MWAYDTCTLGHDLMLQYIAAANETVDARGAVRQAVDDERRNEARRRLAAARVKRQTARERLLRHRLQHDCFSTIMLAPPEDRRKNCLLPLRSFKESECPCSPVP